MDCIHGHLRNLLATAEYEPFPFGHYPAGTKHVPLDASLLHQLPYTRPRGTPPESPVVGSFRIHDLNVRMANFLCCFPHHLSEGLTSTNKTPITPVRPVHPDGKSRGISRKLLYFMKLGVLQDEGGIQNQLLIEFR